MKAKETTLKAIRDTREQAKKDLEKIEPKVAELKAIIKDLDEAETKALLMPDDEGE